MAVWTAVSRARAVANAVPACLAVLFLAPFILSAAAACTSGVLQLNPQPAGVTYDPCRNAYIDRNSLKAVCGAAFKVTVDASNTVRMVPLETGTFNYSGPGPQFPPPPPFDCKDHNASGLFVGSSTTAATVMLYDDFGGPLSNFTKTGPSQVSLAVGHTYNYKGPSFSCTFNYTVVSGCVLDAKPASAKPAPCPPGYISKTGRYGLQYCAMCPRGTFSPGGAATACTPCPIGTANSEGGSAKCRACNGQGEYAATPGLEYCQYCSTYDNKWTDGKTKCEACPANSVPSATMPNQCVRCYKGRKCCTVNWDKDCPKCTRNDAPKTYTSIFALESTKPAACLATNYALCAPKINITIDGTCIISVNNFDNTNNPASDVYCSWSNTLPIKGVTASAVTDLAQLGQYYSQGYTLLEGNVTAVASPYLDVTVPTAKCTFRYRALTSPAATILGAAPKPAPSAPCPAGRYIETATDAKPGPCLPCFPGTFSAKAGTSGACTPCAAGTFSNRYGSTSCTKCPAGKISAKGAASCSFCQQSSSSYANADRVTCSSCPPNTSIYYSGAGACLGSVWGSSCCAAGACGSQVRCDSQELTPTSGDSQTFQSVFRLASKSLGSATCRNATFLSCLRPGASVVINTYSYGLYIDLALTQPSTTCATNSSYTLSSYYGGIAATNRALISGFEGPVGDSVSYEIISNAAARTFTVYLANRPGYISSDLVTQSPDFRKECSATFELVNGFFLDIKPPSTAKCPATAAVITIGGRTFCKFCGLGAFRNSTGACQPCGRGTYQPLFDGTVCRACPAGYACYENNWTPNPCSLGYFGPKARLPDCLQCPPGTYTRYGANKACTKCPPGTISPKQSSACGVPWLTKF